MVERARPLLGTTVAIRVERMAEDEAHRAIEAAFAAVADVHRLMSFHEADSDLSRLHRARCGTRVQLAASTAEVLREALQLSAWSDGAFDVGIAGELVARGLLPPPPGAIAPGHGSWRNIELDDEHGVRLTHPLWIDLGGIAKGYAVDRAITVLREHGAARGCVNAGGDLRLLGESPHFVAIDVAGDGDRDGGHLEAMERPVLELAEAAVATSHARRASAAVPHLDGRTREPAGPGDCVTVVAERCIHADALTKVVLALGEASDDILRRYDATAYRQDAQGRWATLGALS